MIHPCLKGNLVKPPLRLEQGLVITSHSLCGRNVLSIPYCGSSSGCKKPLVIYQCTQNYNLTMLLLEFPFIVTIMPPEHVKVSITFHLQHSHGGVFKTYFQPSQYVCSKSYVTKLATFFTTMLPINVRCLMRFAMIYKAPMIAFLCCQENTTKKTYLKIIEL